MTCLHERQRALAVACLAICMLSACGVSRARTLGKQRAQRFHEAYNASDYDSIYNTASPEFRSTVITQERWSAFCTEMRKRCGQWRHSEPRGRETEVLLVDSGGYIVNVN